MKTILFKVALVASSALCLTGCGASNDSSVKTAESSERHFFYRSLGTRIYSITIEGHKYIVLERSNRGQIIHSESCPCREGTASRNERAQDQFDSSVDR